MSIQWTLINAAMYIELAFCVLLMIPIISPRRWHSIFKSRFLKSMSKQGDTYFKCFLGALAFLFVDAIREQRKYGTELKDHEMNFHLDAEMQVQMRLFRAQRNSYISGFSLMMWLVLQRLVTLISSLATAEAGLQASLAQAKSATATAQQLLDQSTKNKEDSKENSQNKKTNEDNELAELKEEKIKLEAQRNFALKQAEGVKREYDRMLEEHTKLQKEIKSEAATEESRKHD